MEVRLNMNASARMLIHKLFATMLLVCILTAIYIAIRPSQLHWGATEDEIARAMPGDHLVASPDFIATRAVTIQAAPGEIYPWLAQMGYNRAGYYGYDLIENIGSTTCLRSATQIIPTLQHPNVGDPLPISKVASATFAAVQPNAYITWAGGDPPTGSFTWALYPIDAGHTRLVSRIHLHYHWRSPGLLAIDLFTEVADHVAVHKVLLGVQGRAEHRPPQSLPAEAVEISSCIIPFGEFAAALILIFQWRHWLRTWLLALAAGLLFFFALYAHASAWITLALAATIFIALIAIHPAIHR